MLVAQPVLNRCDVDVTNGYNMHQLKPACTPFLVSCFLSSEQLFSHCTLYVMQGGPPRGSPCFAYLIFSGTGGQCRCFWHFPVLECRHKYDAGLMDMYSSQLQCVMPITTNALDKPSSVKHTCYKLLGNFTQDSYVRYHGHKSFKHRGQMRVFWIWWAFLTLQ